MSQTEQLAAKHISVAISLMGQIWVQEQLTASASATASATATGKRGRKAGSIPEADRRCHWHPTGKVQCKNSRYDANSYCKIHLAQVHLVDDSVAETNLSS